MKKIIVALSIILTVSISQAAVVTLPLPEKEMCEVHTAQCEVEKASCVVLAEAYRQQLKKLGFHCTLLKGEVKCITEDQSEETLEEKSKESVKKIEGK